MSSRTLFSIASLRSLAVTILLLASGASAALAQSSKPAVDPQFAVWLSELKAEARGLGISQSTLDSALEGVAPIARVIELDQKQPEFTQTFWNYVDKRVTADRIARGQELLNGLAPLMERIELEFGVPARYLVAFWGLESNFGDYQGEYRVVAALATLAYDDRRGRFFRSQLLDALRILDKGEVSPNKMVGSWAGAMGQVQFLPETYLRYAVDADDDDRRDIWSSTPDALASAANYLKNLGWDGSETWGREVILPPDFDLTLAELGNEKSLLEWSRLGVMRSDGGQLPPITTRGAIILPGGHAGPAFLVYPNFHVIMRWNRSILYAIAVGHLADRIAGGGGLSAQRPETERPLSRDQVMEMQHSLIALGLYSGDADGVVGSKTREALRTFQSQVGLPPDAYPTPELLATLRKAVP
ncbi:MAG: lytic murein transglycosylase [Kiloniellales bacterium]